MKRLLSVTSFVLALGGFAGAQDQPFRFAGAACATPPVLHCPDTDCPSDRVINQGPVVEMKTRRTYFLDYPCDLKPGEPVTFILSLHGAGSYGNWQRHYFPIMDFKDKHRLVIATPNSPTRVVGLLPAPGKGHVMVYDGCKDGRVVADVVRLDKGHTEGLEPNVTEELVRLMLTAKGGKLQQAR